MQRVALLIDSWNLLKAVGRLKRRVNLAELARALAGGCYPSRAFRVGDKIWTCGGPRRPVKRVATTHDFYPTFG
jgi:hypothetical protein